MEKNLAEPVTLYSPEADTLIAYYDKDGCCIGSELVPAGETRTVMTTPGTRGAYFTVSQIIPQPR